VLTLGPKNMPFQSSVLSANNAALKAAEAALARAQQHLDECRSRASLAAQQHQEYKELVKSYAEPCPTIANVAQHEYITGLDLGGGKNESNLGRYYCIVSTTRFSDTIPTKVHSVPLVPIKIFPAPKSAT